MSIRHGTYHGTSEDLSFEIRIEKDQSDHVVRMSGDIRAADRRFLVSFVSGEIRERPELRVVAAPISFRGHSMLTTGELGIEVDERGIGAFRLGVDLQGGHRDIFAGRLEWRGSFIRRIRIEIDGIEGTEPPSAFTAADGSVVDIARAYQSVGFDVEIVIDA
ncbi:MAG: hypothetical protein MI923_00365, partial [Phycisphaerales bacterium]|nr:hypothetical protein [Phycisphaerales bacterium]